jgi:hypothetical protein
MYCTTDKVCCLLHFLLYHALLPFRINVYYNIRIEIRDLYSLDKSCFRNVQPPLRSQSEPMFLL